MPIHSWNLPNTDQHKSYVSWHFFQTEIPFVFSWRSIKLVVFHCNTVSVLFLLKIYMYVTVIQYTFQSVVISLFWTFFLPLSSLKASNCKCCRRLGSGGGGGVCLIPSVHASTFKLLTLLIKNNVFCPSPPPPEETCPLLSLSMSQPERICPLLTMLTDSLKQIKETLGQFLTRLLTFLLKWRFPLKNNQDVINSQLFIEY